MSPGGLAVEIIEASLELLPTDGTLLLQSSVAVRSTALKHVSVDLRILDRLAAPVGFAPIGSFAHSQMVRIEAGVNRITAVHDVGALADGVYNVSIDVADPTMGYHHRAEQCLSFEVAMAPEQGRYRRLQQAWGLGHVELPYLNHQSVLEAGGPALIGGARAAPLVRSGQS
jgi:hypothetical protein